MKIIIFSLAILLIFNIRVYTQETNAEFGTWKVYSNNPVIDVGEEGTFDAGALGSMSVVEAKDMFHMYYEAWEVRSDIEWSREEYYTLSIGHATSKDGITWIKDDNNPVIPRGKRGEWDDRGTWDPFVIYEDGIFKMWYGGNSKGPDNCNWAYAESKDGSHFIKKGKISDLGEVEDLHVVHNEDDGKYYLYYFDRYYEPLGLFCAISENETDFDFENAKSIIIENDYSAHKYKFTHVIKYGNIWYMFYADFVRPHCQTSTTRLALATDGFHFRSYHQNLFHGHDAEIIEVNDTLTYAYYGPNGYFDKKDCPINLVIYHGYFDEMIDSK